MMRPLFSLGGISLLCALLLATVHTLTSQAIEENRTAHAWRLAFELLGERFDASGLRWRDDALLLANGAWLRRTAVPGYAADIHLLAAFSADGRLLGGRAIRHQETPGLGDFIDLDKSSWMLRFAHTPALAVEAVTGATITSNAVKQGMRALETAPAPPAMLQPPIPRRSARDGVLKTSPAPSAMPQPNALDPMQADGVRAT